MRSGPDLRHPTVLRPCGSAGGGRTAGTQDFVGLSPVTVRLKAGAHTPRIVKVGFKEVAIDLPIEEGKPLPRAFNLVAVEIAQV